MPERKPSPEAELIDDVKELALEAATQFLNGIALARRVSEEVTGRVAPNVEGAERGTKPIADVLFGAARLSTNQLKAALSFQRWATDTLVSSLTRNGGKDLGSEPKPPLHLQVRLGDSVTCPVQQPEGAEPIDPKETHVQVWAEGGGPRFYVDFRVGESRAGRTVLELHIDKAKFNATSYSGRIVTRDTRGVETVKPLQLNVSA